MLTQSRTRLGGEEETPAVSSVPLGQPRRESMETPESSRTNESLQKRIADLEAQVRNPPQSSHCEFNLNFHFIYLLLLSDIYIINGYSKNKKKKNKKNKNCISQSYGHRNS